MNVGGRERKRRKGRDCEERGEEYWKVERKRRWMRGGREEIRRRERREDREGGKIGKEREGRV